MTQAQLARAARAFASLSGIARAEIPTKRQFSRFELWPWYIFYIPVMLYWLLLAARHRSLTLPTLANPHMEAGGLYGESKIGILSSIGPEARRWLAPFTHVVTAAHTDIDADVQKALAAMAEAGLSFPLVAKPDIGCRGTGVRLINDEAGLAAYLEAFPRAARVILQKFVAKEGEAGILYVRRPEAPNGTIFSLTLKYFPRVVGDGRSTLRDLILKDPRARRIAPIYFRRHARNLDRIVPENEQVRLVFTGNHCKGAIFRDGARYITPALTARCDAIARSLPAFHFGRFDVRFDSLAELMRGEGFTIIEINGAGSEATHIWDRRMSLIETYRVLFAQIDLIFAIGQAYRAQGFRPMSPVAFLRLCARQRRLMAQAPVDK